MFCRICYLLPWIFPIINTERTIALGHSENKELQEPATLTFEDLCMNACLCGLMSHPFQAMLNGGGIFARYQDNHFTKINNSEYILKWFDRKLSQVTLEYPTRNIFCIQRKFKVIPKIGNKTRALSGISFLPNLNILSLTQGSLRRLTSADMNDYKTTLLYLDLSHNHISEIDQDTFSQLTRLQIIDLQFNRLHKIGNENTGIVTAGWMKPKLLAFGNPLVCTCGLILTITSFTTIPADRSSCCSLVNSTSSKCDHDIGLETVVHELLESLCTAPETKPMKVELSVTTVHKILQDGEGLDHVFHDKVVEEGHHVVDNNLNNTQAEGGDVEESLAPEILHAHRVFKSRERIDLPLLITMSAWFAMLYVGISKFIKSNEMDRETHKNYLNRLPTKSLPV